MLFHYDHPPSVQLKFNRSSPFYGPKQSFYIFELRHLSGKPNILDIYLIFYVNTIPSSDVVHHILERDIVKGKISCPPCCYIISIDLFDCYFFDWSSWISWSLGLSTWYWLGELLSMETFTLPSTNVVVT